MITRKVKTFWLYLFTLALLLTGCATPNQMPVGNDQVQVDPTSLPTQAPILTPTAIAKSAGITPEVVEPGTPTAQPEDECSQVVLGESALMAVWDRKQKQHILTPINPLSGQTLCAYDPLPIGRNYFHTFTADGNHLAIVSYQREDGRDGVLQLIDLQNWQAIPASIKFDNWVNVMDFSPDGNTLAIASAGLPTGKHGLPDGYHMVVVDLKSQSVTAEKLLELVPRLVHFTADGASIVVYGGSVTEADMTQADAQVLLMDPATLTTQWETRLKGLSDGQVWTDESNNPDSFTLWSPAVVFSPEKQAVYIVHANANQLTTVDIAKRTASTIEIQPATSWIERLLALTAGVAQAKGLNGAVKSAVLSGDGSRLYVVGESGVVSKDANGEWQFSREVLGLKVIDTASGREIARRETEATDPALSRDGRFLFLRGWSETAWTDVFDAESLELVTHLAGRFLISSRLLNGEAVLLSNIQSGSGLTSLASLDPASFEEIKAWKVRDSAYWLVPP